MAEKIVVFKFKDGRIVNTREEAVREELKVDVIGKMTAAVAQRGAVTPELKAAIGVVVNSMIEAGWRPPVKAYKKNAKAV